MARNFPNYGKVFLSMASTNIELNNYKEAVDAYRQFITAAKQGKFVFNPVVGGVDQTIPQDEFYETVVMTSINYLSPQKQELAAEAYQEASDELSAK